MRVAAGWIYRWRGMVLGCALLSAAGAGVWGWGAPPAAAGVVEIESEGETAGGAVEENEGGVPAAKGRVEQGGGETGETAGDAGEAALEEGGVRDFLERWRGAWERKDAKRYCDCYSSRFERNGMDRARFCSDKAAKFGRAERIVVGIDQIEMRRSGAGVSVRFVQSYDSGAFRDVGVKRMEIERESGVLRIVSEEFDPLAPAEAAARAGQEATPARAEGGEAAATQVPAELRDVRLFRFGVAEMIEIVVEGRTSPGVSRPRPGVLRVTLLPAWNRLAYGPELRSALVEGVSIEERGGNHPCVLLDFALASPAVRPGAPEVGESGIRIRLSATE